MESQTVDILFLAGGALLWGALALMVLGLQRLDKQDGKDAAATAGR